jgi:hypothetical protein
VTWKSVGVYWVLAALVAVELAWSLQQRQGPDEPERATLVPAIEAAASDIDRLRAERGPDALEFKKEAGRWVLESPAQGMVASDLVAALIDTLTTVPPVEMLAEHGSKLAAYGLEPPQMSVRMASAGAPVATLELGARNPTRTAVYARRPDIDKLYLLGLNAQYYLDLIFEQAAGPPPAVGDS